MRARLFTLTLVFLSLGAAKSHATPALLRTKNISCNLSMDGNFIGAIGDSYFIGVNVGPGDHIVNCTNSFALTLDQAQGSKVVMLPFAISTTVSIPDSSAQVIIDLPDPVITLADAAKAGVGHFYAQFEFIQDWQTAIMSNSCGTNDYQAAVDDAMEEGSQMRERRNKVINDSNSETFDTCASSPKDCTEAQHEKRDAVEKASDKVDLAQAHFNTALRDRNKFYNALANGNIAVYPSLAKTCGTSRLITIGYKGDFFLAPPNFVIKSDQGGTFHIR